MTSDDDNGYQVGYGKPPKSRQFIKGQSGNPKGRPKGSKNFDKDLEAELDASIHINENGKRMKINKQKAFAKQLVNKAMSGDPRAMPLLLNEIRQRDARKYRAAINSEEPSPSPELDNITVEDANALYQKAIKNARPENS